jgi:hypothetical protein
LVFPFLRVSASDSRNQHIDEAFSKYSRLFNRLIFASPEALAQFVRQGELMAGMNSFLLKSGEIDIMSAFGKGFEVRTLGKNSQYFALTLVGQDMQRYLEEFYSLENSLKPKLRAVFEIASRKMRTNPTD